MGVKVRERKTGQRWVFVNYGGQRRAKKVGSKRAALELKSEIEKKIGAAEFQIKAPPPVPTFEEYTGKWQEGYGKASLKPSPQCGCTNILKAHLIPVIPHDIRDGISGSPNLAKE